MSSFQERPAPDANEVSGPTEGYAPPTGRGSAIRTWGRQGGLAAIAIAVLAVINQLRLIGRAWFFADDLLNFQIARQMGFSWDYLSRSFFGHFLPGHRLVNLAFVGAGGGWTAALCISLGGLFVCLLMFDWVLRLYGVATAPRLRSLLSVAFAIPLISGMIWWSAAMNCIPAMFTSLLAIALYRKAADANSALLAIGAAISCFVGTTFIEFVAFTPIFILILESERWHAGEASRRRWRVPRDAVAFGAASAVLHLAYAAYYLSQAYREESGDPPTLARFIAYADWAVLRGYGASLFGLDAIRFDHDLQVRLGFAALLFFIGGAVYLCTQFRRQGRVLVAFLVVMTLHVTLVGIGRARVGGPRVGLDHRYFADIVWLLPFTVALATRHRRSEPSESRRRLSQLLLNVGGAAVALVAVYSAGGVARTHPATLAGTYERRIEGAAPAEVLDGRLPDWLLPAIYDPYNHIAGGTNGLIPGVSAGTDASSQLAVGPSGEVVSATLTAMAAFGSDGAQCLTATDELLEVPFSVVAPQPEGISDRILLLKGRVVRGDVWVVETSNPGGPVVRFSGRGDGTEFDRSVSVGLVAGSTSTISIGLAPGSSACFDVAEYAAVSLPAG